MRLEVDDDGDISLTRRRRIEYLETLSVTRYL